MSWDAVDPRILNIDQTSYTYDEPIIEIVTYFVTNDTIVEVSRYFKPDNALALMHTSSPIHLFTMVPHGRYIIL